MKAQSGIIEIYKNIVKNQHKISTGLNGIRQKISTLELLCTEFAKNYPEFDLDDELDAKLTVANEALKLFYGEDVLDELEEKKAAKQNEKKWFYKIKKMIARHGCLNIASKACPICGCMLSRGDKKHIEVSETAVITCGQRAKSYTFHIDDLA